MKNPQFEGKNIACIIPDELSIYIQLLTLKSNKLWKVSCILY